jgi:hypothetical protein
LRMVGSEEMRRAGFLWRRECALREERNNECANAGESRCKTLFYFLNVQDFFY